MPRGYLPSLLVLVAIWGSSYMFIKIAVEEIEPAAMVELRLLSALVVLVGFVAFRFGRRAPAELRAALSGGLVLGVINMAIPFTLIAWGEQYVDSGIAAIANSTVPIFVALLAIRFRPSERARGLRLAGILVGLVGVVVLNGLDPAGGWWAVAGTMAIVVASLSYASANLFTQHRFQRTSPVVVATAATAAASVVLLPYALVQLPDQAPGWDAVGSTLVLGILGTAVASIFLYRMLVRYGSARTSLVAYLLPAAALAYGAVFLDEAVTANALGGLALILGGVALASGALRLPPARDCVGVSALAGEGFVLRRATEADLAFMVALATSPDVEPAMSGSAAKDEDAFRAELERAEAEPESFGRFVLEVDVRPAGLFAFAVENRRSRIAHLFGLMLHPDFRGRGLADAGARVLVRHLVFDLDYHRVQLEVYGFNEAGLRHAERAGFVREGVKRRAYWRHDRWVDGVLFAITREDLE